MVVLALGENARRDIAMLRGKPGVYGLVASDPTVSRDIIAALAQAADRAVAAVTRSTPLGLVRPSALAEGHVSYAAAGARHGAGARHRQISL